MAQELHAGTSFELSTRSLAPERGLATLQELFHSKVQLQLVAEPDRPVEANMTVHGLPGLRRARMVSKLDASLKRRRTMLGDGEDDVCLIMKTGGQLAIEQRGQQTVARTGDAVVLVYRETATLDFLGMNYLAVRVPFRALAPLSTDVESTAAVRVRRETAALQLLRAYLASLPARLAEPELRGLITTHVYDLMALALGPTAEAREMALFRGVRAARLEAIRSEVRADAGVTLDQVAARQGVSPRYVQKLFEETGTTFTAFVLESRLERARAMLQSPRYAHLTVTEISMEAGFGDLSYFNRRFKARYDRTPTEMRAEPGP